MIKVMEQFEAEKKQWQVHIHHKWISLWKTRMLWNWKRIWVFA